jgi:hypothetical protein
MKPIEELFRSSGSGALMVKKAKSNHRNSTQKNR